MATTPTPVDTIFTDENKTEQEEVSVITINEDSIVEGVVKDNILDGDVPEMMSETQGIQEKRPSVDANVLCSRTAGTRTVSSLPSTRKTSKSLAATTGEALQYLASRLKMEDPSQVQNLSGPKVEESSVKASDVTSDNEDKLSHDPLEVLLQTLSKDQEKEESLDSDEVEVAQEDICGNLEVQNEGQNIEDFSDKEDEEPNLSFRASDVSSLDETHLVVEDANLVGSYSILGHEGQEELENEPSASDDIQSNLQEGGEDVEKSEGNWVVNAAPSVLETENQVEVTKATVTVEANAVPKPTETEELAKHKEHDLDILVAIGNHLLQDVAAIPAETEPVAPKKFSRKVKVALASLFMVATTGTAWFVFSGVRKSSIGLKAKDAISQSDDVAEMASSSLHSDSLPLSLIGLGVSIFTENTKNWTDSFDAIELDDMITKGEDSSSSQLAKPSLPSAEPEIDFDDMLMNVEATDIFDGDVIHDVPELTLPSADIAFDSKVKTVQISQEDRHGSDEQYKMQDNGHEEHENTSTGKFWSMTKSLLFGIVALHLFTNSAASNKASAPEQGSNHSVATNDHDEEEDEQIWDLSEYERLKVVELRDLLRARSLKTVGRKHVLIERLVNVYSAELETLTVMQLRPLLKQKGCKQSGRKVELIRRLVEAGMD